ncbi:FHA domain-containing protein [Streptomyces sp. NBRC 110611]|uniref:FHA domain-containing protein n=1 Tax=Streptomyces sp. NBRC 110611 TaxID=1621259 RepID=UPI000858C287|nr:FHA domain-containing protein [Streptomyces sp. NBRC 110611]GAU67936.1 FHA domain-containing protein [Streptomyces sp. NBRC 110611]
MQIRLTVLGPRSGPATRACDVLVTAPAGTALAAVAGSLAASVASTGADVGGPGGGSGPVVLYAGTERLDPQRAAIGEPPLIDGAVLSLQGPGPAPAHGLPHGTARLRVVSGPDAGGVHLLHGGQIRIGRSADADVPLDDPDVSRLHCAVTVEPDGSVHVTDLHSTNGTAIDGTGLDDRPAPLHPGALLRIGESALRLQPAPAAPEPVLHTASDGEGRLRITPGADGGYAHTTPDGAAGPPPGTAAAFPVPSPRTPSAQGATTRRDTPLRGTTPARPPAPGRARAGETPLPDTASSGFGSGFGSPQHSAASAPGAAEAPEATSPDTASPAGATAHGTGHAARQGVVGPGGGPGLDRTLGDSRRATGFAPGLHEAHPYAPPAGTTTTHPTHSGQHPLAPPDDVRDHNAPHTPRAPRTDHTAPADHTGSSAPADHADRTDPADRTDEARRKGGRRGGIGAWARRLTGGRPTPERPYADRTPPPAAHEPTTAAAPSPFGTPEGGPTASAPSGPPADARWPDAAAILLTALGPGPRLWERGPEHPDALTVRLGTADRAGGRAAEPVTVELRRAGSLGLAGPRARLTGLARSAIAQLAALHSPGTLDIVLISTDRARGTEERVADWSWLGWLPHTRPARGQDCRLLLAYDKEQATARTTELVRRLDDSPLGPGWASADRSEVTSAATRYQGPYTLVIVDGDPDSSTLRETTARLAAGGPAAGIHLLCLTETPAASPAFPLAATYEAARAASPAFGECGAVAVLSGDVATALRVVQPGSGPNGTVATVDAVSAAWAERFARALAPLREADPTATAGRTVHRAATPLPDSARLLDELGLARATPASLMARWAAALDTGQPGAAAVLGAGPHGPLCADLAADGTSLLLEGAPASGKTELLRSLAASLAAADRPDLLSLVLVDGGGSERGEGLRVCTDLPHVTTYLAASDPVRMREFAQALSSELKRRAEVLAGTPFADWRAKHLPSPQIIAPRRSTENGDTTQEQITLRNRCRNKEEAGGTTATPSTTSTLRLRPPQPRTQPQHQPEPQPQAQPQHPQPQPQSHPAPPTHPHPTSPHPQPTQDTNPSPIPPSAQHHHPHTPHPRPAPTDPATPMPRLFVLVDDFDALVAPALGSPGRPAAGSVVRALEAVARDGAALGVHLIAATGHPDRTADTATSERAGLRIELGTSATTTAPSEPAPAGRGLLHRAADGSSTPFQAGRVTGRIPRTSTLRPTVVPLEWQRMGDPPARRPLRELGNGPTDLALLASALQRAAQSSNASPPPPLV